MLSIGEMRLLPLSASSEVTAQASAGLELLRRHPVFSVLPEQELRSLIAAGKARSVADQGPVFLAGEPAQSVILLLHGSAKVSKQGRAVAELRAGDIAGAHYLAGQHTRLASIHAQGALQVLELPGPFEALQARFPAFAAQVLALNQTRDKQLSPPPLDAGLPPQLPAQLAEGRHARPNHGTNPGVAGSSGLLGVFRLSQEGR